MKVTRSILFVLLVATSLAWVCVTNQGLHLLLKGICFFAPGNLSYKQAQGSLISPKLCIRGLTALQQGQTIIIDTLEVTPRQLSVIAKNIHGWAGIIPSSKIVNIDPEAHINQLTAELTLYRDHEVLNIQTDGVWHQKPTSLTANFTRKNERWKLDDMHAQLANNKFSVSNATHNLNWQVALLQPELFLKDGAGQLYATGTLIIDKVARIEGHIQSDHFAVSTLQLSNFDAKISMADRFKINAKAKQLVVANKRFNNVTLESKGNKAIRKNAWYSDSLKIQSDEYTIDGALEYDLGQNKLQLTASDTWYDANINLSFTTQTISGKINAYTEDISHLMKFVPEMTRLKGKAKATLNISGRFTDPLVKADAHITDITATFPGLGVKVKPMELHVTTEKFKRFVINGKGQMRRGPGSFTIDGYIEPFTDKIPNEIHLLSNSMEFVNNDTARLNASSDLKFVYHNDTDLLDITGDLIIESGHVNFVPKKNSTPKSKDVVFINEPKTQNKAITRINPNIFLRIEDGVKFKGFGLDAVVSGKLDINKPKDAMYANGRITIKEGIYKLPGQDLTINKGRLLYPPGTLLVNPMLDIKMHSGTRDDSLEVQVSGTAQKPLINESTLTQDHDKAVSQALLASSGFVTNDLLQDKLKLTELGLIEDEHNANLFASPTTGSSDLKNKQLVVGRPLGKRIHAQYLHSIDEAKKRLRFKFSLNDNWEIGIEGGEQGAAGADLSFVIERD